jgi:lysophospholipase L1-like esterase
VFYEKPLPIGISGFTIETVESKAELNLEVKDQPGLGYSFNKFILFHEKGFNSYDISVCDNTNCERARFTSIDSTSNPYISEMKLASPVNQIILKSISTDTGRMQRTRIYGMLLENDSSGVLYNMIGVNGAEYRHYTLSEHFTQQLAYLNSDLIIISMGTNEAFNKGFNKDVFYRQIDTLIRKIKSTNPNACLLLTTPGDSFRKSKKGRVKNPDVKLAEETIIKYCLSNNVAYWDLLEIMGGSGSMAKWNKAKLSSKDFVHFSPKGYQIQGNLLYEALMKDK